MSEQARPQLLIVGVYQATDAYPNTLYRLRALRERFNVRELNTPLWTTPEGGVASARSPLKTLVRALSIHSRLLFASIVGPRSELAYVPYPGLGMMLFLGLLPRWWRPKRIVLDGFISIYDTVINDRRLWSSDSLRARILWLLERRAFRIADLVIVDTPQNADFYARIFVLPSAKFLSLPLATNETDFPLVPYNRTDGTCRVLFVGTLVPLHGMETIVAAARLLTNRPDIKFRILGDGHDARKLEETLAHLPNVVWQRRWLSSTEVASEIADADICLGIFGNTDKAQRVCPYKLYAYASIGRATITGDTNWLRSASSRPEDLPFYGVAVNDPQALADAIVWLWDSPSERKRLADVARTFYEEKLANEISTQALSDLLLNSIHG